MHSVLRFLDVSQLQMHEITNWINELLPGFCENISPSIKCDTLFSFTISEKEKWFDNHSEIVHTLISIAPALVKAREKYPTLELHIDLAVHEVDYKGHFTTEIYWTNELLTILSEQKIFLIVTVYNTDF